ncbi:MAG: Crp/Fnr family transcriptional regulator [Nitrospira sp.]|nr:Crp/Fnr family transcriptional regulator [Nitrospira sp.]ULA60659.1 MAG: Crp/Fnr family transcriptional regulator [Nitrospira sp.]
MNRPADRTSPCCTTQKQTGRGNIFELDGDTLEDFHGIRIPLSYRTNQAVFYEGHVSIGLYVLCEGKVKLTRSSYKGQRLIVRILDAGEIIEKHAFAQNAVHQTTCETLEPCKICLIERRAYLDLVKRDSTLALKLIEMLSSEVRSNLTQLDTFTFKSARERLAATLLELARRFGSAGQNGIQIGMNLKREELAEMTGITPETLARLLGAFQAEKLLATHGKLITLTNLQRLARLARGRASDLRESALDVAPVLL